MPDHLPDDVQRMVYGKRIEELALTVVYTNWKGETSPRRIIPLQFSYGKTDYHPEEQWLLRVWDLDKQDYRTYALQGIQWNRS